jgi:GR25 family glycosyltransferase involved in LPS biosynthesis
MNKIKCYWINKNSRIDRRMFMSAQFEVSGLDNERIQAIEPKTLFAIHTGQQPRRKEAEYACVCSHIVALSRGLKDGGEWFLVAEDDIEIPPNFETVLEELTKTAPKDADILQLHTNHHPSVIELYKQCVNEGKTFVEWNEFWSTGLYLISRQASKLFLETVVRTKENRVVVDLSKQDYPHVADQLLYRICKTYTTTYPYITTQSKLGSDIHDEDVVFHDISNMVTRRIQQRGAPVPLELRVHSQGNGLSPDKGLELDVRKSFPVAMNGKEITLYVDTQKSDTQESGEQVFWAVEPDSICPDITLHLKNCYSQYDQIFTYDTDILKLSNARLFNFGTTFVKSNEYREALCFGISGVFSNKVMCLGHVIRQQVYYSQREIQIPKVFYRGQGHESVENNPVAPKEATEKAVCFEHYMFHLAMENTRIPHYFTEKLLDCFLMKVVPVYWGCKNISSYFDARGIIEVTGDAHDIIQRINALRTEDYHSRKPYIENNYKLAMLYIENTTRFARALSYSYELHDQPPIYIIPKGGYGNILFTVMYGLTLGRMYNRRVHFYTGYKDKRMSIKEYEILRSKLSLRDTLPSNYLIMKENTFKYNVDHVRLPRERAVVCDGYFQSRKYFEHNISHIKAQLYGEFGEDSLDLGARVPRVAVHVRRGDYKQYPTIHPMQEQTYFAKGMAIVTEKYTDVQFVIFSDDMEEVRGWACFAGRNCEFVETGDVVSEHDALRACDHFIISNSSFSLSAYYLRESKGPSMLIAPRQWFGRDGPAHDIYDLVPENTIFIS